MTSNILRLNDVKKKTGLSRSSIYAYEKEGHFPQRISLGIRCVGWLESEITDWVNKRIKQRGGQP